jgi:hypothetical protein
MAKAMRQLLVAELFWWLNPIDRNIGTKNSPPPTPTRPATAPIAKASKHKVNDCCASVRSEVYASADLARKSATENQFHPTDLKARSSLTLQLARHLDV